MLPCEISIKKGSQPPNEIENMLLGFDETVYFAIGCHFQLEKCKNMKFFSYPKIFSKFETTISRLLFMAGTSATAQIKGFPISFQYLLIHNPKFSPSCEKWLKPRVAVDTRITKIFEKIDHDVFQPHYTPYGLKTLQRRFLLEF